MTFCVRHEQHPVLRVERNGCCGRGFDVRRQVELLQRRQHKNEPEIHEKSGCDKPQEQRAQCVDGFMRRPDDRLFPAPSDFSHDAPPRLCFDCASISRAARCLLAFTLRMSSWHCSGVIRSPQAIVENTRVRNICRPMISTINCSALRVRADLASFKSTSRIHSPRLSQPRRSQSWASSWSVTFVLTVTSRAA